MGAMKNADRISLLSRRHPCNAVIKPQLIVAKKALWLGYNHILPPLLEIPYQANEVVEPHELGK